MRILATRLSLACASAIAIASLAACGGGTAASNPVTPVAQASAAPPTPTPSPYPSADGDAFAYRGTLVQQFTNYGTPAPAPSASASPEPTSTPWVTTNTQDVSQNVVVHAGASFNGQSGLTELETNETDTGAQRTYTIDSKQYLQFATDAARSNGIDVLQSGVDATDSNGVQFTTTFGSGTGLIDELPQIPFAQWKNSAARVTAENDPSGEFLTTTYADDGTYSGTSTFPQGDTATIIENGDGSGSYVLPLSGTPGSEVTVSPVLDDAIDITFKENVMWGGVGWGSVPVWYPNVPPVLASDTFTDAGSMAIPAGCNVPSKFGSQATRIDETRERLDSIFGEIETATQSSYVVPPYGAVCVVVRDDLTVYYDYSGQSGYIFSGTPLRHVVTGETLGLQSATLASAKTRTSLAGANANVAIFAAPSTARLELSLAKQHLQFVRRMSAAMREAR